jgi:hypothetical protein
MVPALLLLAACGAGPQPPTLPEEKPRDLGPEDIGPVPPEQRSVDTDAYSVQVEGPSSAAVRAKVRATVTVRAKEGLFVSGPDEWKIETRGPSDVDISPPVVAGLAAASAVPPGDQAQRTSMTYTVTVVPLRAGIRHISFKLDGSVCDESFCDVVGDQVSWNLEVR